MSTAALIISPKKDGVDPFHKVGSISIIERQIMTFRLAGISEILIIVSEEYHKKLKRHTSGLGATFILNENSSSDMFDDVCLGLTSLYKSFDKILITPMHVSLFSVNTLNLLINSNSKLAIPLYNDKKGHPILINREIVPNILNYKGYGGLNQAINELSITPTLINVDDEGILAKVYKKSSFDEIALNHSLNNLRPIIQVKIAKESIILGPGSKQLLLLIQNTGSVRLASEQMGLSYSKAWKILNNLEEQLGFPVVIRKQGGKQGGETHLTKEGFDLLEKYEKFENECNTVVNDIFNKYF